jgi:hypothetical protein
VSCETTANPITSYGNTHWILYDFGYAYSLYDVKLWNANDPAHLDYGIQDYAIDYSLDAVNWNHLGNYTLNQASGLSIYEGEMGPNFSGVTARYMLLTPLSNYGGSCFALSEIKIYVDEFAANQEELNLAFNSYVQPNPFKDDLQVFVKTDYPNSPIKYVLYDVLGRTIFKKTIQDVTVENKIIISGKNLPTGLYFLKIKHHNQSQTIKVIRN